jgi:two-component system LytT family response regulator
MRVLVVDDEAPARRRLVRMLRAVDDAAVVGEASSGHEAVTAIRTLTPDLVFLDVQMPGLDGFQVIETVGAAAMPPVVFVTAFDAYALRAFEVQALDYLLKPFPPERLAAVVDRVRSRIAAGRAHAPPMEGAGAGAAGTSVRSPLPPLHRLLVSDGRRDVLVPVASIERFEAEGNYVRVHLADRVHLVRQTIAALEARLEPGRFLRANRSTLVRVAAIAEIQPWFHGDRRLVLRDGSVHMWSRRYRARDKETFT